MRGVRVLLVTVVVMLLAACSSPTIPEPNLGTTAASPTRSGSLVDDRVTAGIADCPQTDSGPPAIAGGLPDVTVPCLGGGGTVRLSALRGPLVVNLWAQWCGPCRAEAPHLREFHALAVGKVTLLGLDLADPDPGLAIEFAKAAGWTYPQVADPDRAAARALGINSLPMTLFVDASGRIVHTQVGAFGSTDQIRALSAQFLQVTV